MVTMRSFGEMKAESAFSSVVFPAPVPPEMMMFSLRLDRALRAAPSCPGRAPAFATRSGRHQLVRAETADREQRTVDGQRRNDGVDARAVAQARVDHRRRFVDAAAHLRDDLVDDAQQVLVVAERDAGQFEQTLALDVDLPGGRSPECRRSWVLQQRLERPQAENLVQHLVADLLLLERAAAASARCRSAR